MPSHPSPQLLAFLALLTPSLAAFGPSFSTGPVASGTFIREAISTLAVPSGNLPLAGYASLWTGMGTSNGDLVQAICDRHPGDGNGTLCEDITSNNGWCRYAYTLKESEQQIMGSQASVTAGDEFTMHYVYNESTKDYDQYALINGKQISMISTSSGMAEGWGTAVECAATDCGTMPAHKWINTVLTFNASDPTYSQTAYTQGGATTSGFSTSDGGLTWKVTTISIPEFTFSCCRRET